MTFTRRLVSAATQLTLSNGFLRLLSIVTMPILTALLSPQAYGVAALAGTVISLMSVFALAGIDISYGRAYPGAQQPAAIGIETYCWRFAMLGGLLTAVLSALAWWFFNRDSVALDRNLAILLALGIVFSVAHTMANARARLSGRYREMATAIVASGIIASAAGIAIAAVWRQDALALLLPLLLTYLIPVLLLGAPSIGRLATPSGLAGKEGAALIKIGLAGIVTAPMFWLLSFSDRWFLGHFHGAEAVGVYSIGYSVAIVGMMVNTAVTSVWLPEAVREYEEDRVRARITLGRLMSRLMALMALIWLVVAAAGGDIVRWLANERFHAAADYVPYIASGVFFHGVLHLANTGLLLVKQLNWAALWWFAGGSVCILLNVALVPRYGGIGAAVTQGASFAVISLGILATSQAKFRVRLDGRSLAATILLILPAGVLMAPPWNASAPFSLLMKLPFGIAVAVIVALLAAPDWCAKGIDHLRRRAFS